MAGSTFGQRACRRPRQSASSRASVLGDRVRPRSPERRDSLSCSCPPRHDTFARKIHNARKSLPAPIVRTHAGAKIGLVTVGACHAACLEALDLLAQDGIVVDFMRVRGYPFADEVGAFLEAHEMNFVVEQNRDAQLRSLLMLETGVPVEKLESVRYYGGFPMSAQHVITGVKAKLEKAA